MFILILLIVDGLHIAYQWLTQYYLYSTHDYRHWGHTCPEIVIHARNSGIYIRIHDNVL
jgi:hypothetical protein